MHRFRHSPENLSPIQPEHWEWPMPPFPCEPTTPHAGRSAEPCRIESSDGATVDGLFVSMAPSVGIVSFRAGGDVQAMPFARLRRLTLTTSWGLQLRGNERHSARGIEAPEDCEYRLKSTASGLGTMVGRTVGHVQTREGIFLFPLNDRRDGVQRVFVPRTAFSDQQFGPFTEDVPGMREIADPGELLDAIARQRSMKVLPIGNSLLQLRLVTRLQLENALAQQSQNQPLGETLVKSGVISRTNLERALAHKLGYPLINLEHFPIDPMALKALTLRSAIAMRAVPVMSDGTKLVVAVSKVSRANNLRVFPASGKRTLVPVIAPKDRILEALTRMSEHQAWDGVPFSLRFFETTT